MWEVIFETFLFLTVAAVLGAAIGFVLSNIISSSKIEFLEEENWQLKQDNRKFQNNFLKRESDAASEKPDIPIHSTSNYNTVKNAKHKEEIQKLKSEIEVLKDDAEHAKFDLSSFNELKERYDELLRERELLIQKLEDTEQQQAIQKAPQEIPLEKKPIVTSRIAPDIIKPMVVPLNTEKNETQTKKTENSDSPDELEQLYAEQPVYMEAVYLEEIKMKALNFDYSRIGTRKIGGSDNLQAIEGIGALVEKKLKAIDINSYAQLSKLDEQTTTELSAIIGYSKTRIQSEDWQAQAKELLKQRV